MSDKNNVERLHPSDSFEYVLEELKPVLECGIVIGYDSDGTLLAAFGGLQDGLRLDHKDVLWMLESYKAYLTSSPYDSEYQ